MVLPSVNGDGRIKFGIGVYIDIRAGIRTLFTWARRANYL